MFFLWKLGECNGQHLVPQGKVWLRKAFFIVFEMNASTKSMSSVQIGKQYGISQTTAWFFMQKVRDEMQSSVQYLLTGRVHVNEGGGKENDKRSRSYDTKKYDIDHVPRNKGKNFKELHTVIEQIKSWLRTIPSRIREKHVQAYFDEFCYRINRSIFKQTIFHKII